MVQICPKGCVYRLLGTIRIRAEPDDDDDDDVCHQSQALASLDLCHVLLQLSLLGLYTSKILSLFLELTLCLLVNWLPNNRKKYRKNIIAIWIVLLHRK